ncbi:hypothetical protein JNUCC76_06785 [Leuconostoc sp. JNUCC 76]
MKGVASCKDEIIASTDQHFVSDQYTKQIKQIYQALPQDLHGKWQVGNTNLTSGRGRMAKANLLTSDLIDKVLQNNEENTYSKFISLAKIYDDFNIEDQGVMRKGQRKWSENKEAELKKRLANQLYRHLNVIDEPETIDQQLASIFDRIKSQKPHKDKNSSKWSSENLKGTEKQVYSMNNQAVLNSKSEPQIFKNNRSINKISRIWQQEVRAELPAERRFMDNQRKEIVERQQAEYENHVSRGR